MQGFALILGHLIGDYIVQNDWMAANKTSRSWPCTVHCLLYTLACAATCFWFLPWWAYPVIFAAHWPVDRFRLAGRWMRNVSGQHAFATGPMSPWSIVVVDNTLHLTVLFMLGFSGG